MIRACLMLCVCLMLLAGISGAEMWQEPSDNERGVQVNIVHLGTWTTVVAYDGQQFEVPTSALQLSETVPAAQRFAVIRAPRTGQCTMYSYATENSPVLQHCMAGTIVLVLRPGETWTQIAVNGATGYVKTSGLTFCPLQTEIVGYALVSRDGRTDGRQTVTLRHEPFSYVPRLFDLPTGTRVTVLTSRNGWCEIETEGKRGFIREQNLIPMDDTE